MDLQIGYDDNNEVVMKQPPLCLTSGFELALINAATDLWGPALSIYLCFFHFKQSMWRKIQELGPSPSPCPEYLNFKNNSFIFNLVFVF